MLISVLFATHIAVCAVLIAGPGAARRVSVLLGVAAAALAWLSPGEAPWLRALIALGCLWVLAKLIDIAPDPRRRSYVWRLWYLTSPFDARLSRPRPSSILRSQLLAVFGYGALAVPGAILAFVVAPELTGGLRYAARWGGAAVVFYAGVEATVAAITTAHAGIGIEIPQIQHAPIRARSVGEFWSQRWNRPVSRWLRMHCFLPLARRGWPLAGLAATFVVSGYLHFHFVWAALGLSAAALMGLFFVVQIPLVLAERALAVKRWRVAAQRAWTIGTLAVASPLFLEPLLRVVESAR